MCSIPEKVKRFNHFAFPLLFSIAEVRRTLGWLLFAIFLTGAATYYRHEINLWMQPQFATMQVKQDTAMKSAYQYLQKNAADAQSWYIGVASPRAC